MRVSVPQRWDSPSTWGSVVALREFPALDLKTREQLRLRERPLVVMDETLFGYMGLEWRQALDRILKLSDTCRRLKGDSRSCGTTAA